jgi:hypothetical protein
MKLSWLLASVLFISNPFKMECFGQWTSDPSVNLAISTAAGDQWQGFYTKSSICSDGAGGAITCWYNNAAPFEINTARVNSSGVLLWTVTVCSVIGSTPRMNPTIQADGAGGAIVVWQDWRDTTTQYPPGNSQDIYGARLGPSGNFIWGEANGTAIAKGGSDTGNKYYPVMCSDGANGAIITWQSQIANGEIYAKHVSAAGAISWGGTAGLLICNAANNQVNPAITSDGAGGAIIAWGDERNGNTNQDIYAKRLDPAGATIWGGAQGTAICSASGNQTQVVLTGDGANGAILGWIDTRSGQRVSAQRVNSNGIVQWTVDGVALTSTGTNEDLVITSNGAGGAYLAWNSSANTQGSSAGAQNVFAQHINASGNIQWATAGLPIYNQSATQWRPNIQPTSNGEMIIAWGDYRGSTGYSDIYAQQVRADGSFAWTPSTGVQITSANCSQGGGRVSVINDGCDGAILTWMDRRNSVNCGAVNDIFAQNIKTDGTLGGISGNCTLPLIASTSFSNASCSNASDGTATVVLSGGTEPYIISWNTTPTQTGLTATGLSPGQYIVTVTDAGSGSYSDTVTVSSESNPNAGTISASENTVCSGTTVTLTVSGSSGSIQWRSSQDGSGFTDIPGATGLSYSQVITEPTYFQVSAGTGSCVVYSSNQQINVSSSPTADFSFSENGLEVSFKDSSSNDAISFSWSFGDGGSSTSQNPLHTFNTEGTYEVCLSVKNASDCRDTMCKQVEVKIISIADLDKLTAWSVFPNPFEDYVQLSSRGQNDRIMKIECYDLLGRTQLSCENLKTIETGNYLIKLGVLPAGTYFLKVTTATSSSVFSVVKSK